MKSSLRPLQNPIFGAFLRDVLLERLKIFQYYLRVLRCYHFELHSNLGFCKGLSLHFKSTKKCRLLCHLRELFGFFSRLFFQCSKAID